MTHASQLPRTPKKVGFHVFATMCKLNCDNTLNSQSQCTTADDLH